MHKVLADAYFVAKEYDKSMPEAQTSVYIMEKYVGQLKTDHQRELALRDLGSAQIVLGNLFFRSNQPELGCKSFDRAVQIFKADSRANPQSLATMYNLCKVYSEYGDWCIIKMDNPSQALKYFLLAQQQNRLLCGAHEVVNVQQMGLALGYYRLGMAAQATGQKQEAKEYYDRCRELREMRVREVGLELGDKPNRKYHDTQIDLMLVQARCGMVADVLKSAESLIDLAASVGPLRPRNQAQRAEANENRAHYQLFAGVAYGLLSWELTPSDPRRAYCVAKAIDLIHMAVANDFANYWFLENDADLDPIRFLPEYQERVLKYLKDKQAEKAKKIMNSVW
jgi:hypothetical protein